MSAQTRTTLKGYFNTGDTPTETQFANLIDSFLQSGEEATGVARGRPTLSGTSQLSIPGVEVGAAASQSTTSGRLYYEPIFVSTSITLDQLVCEVTTGGAASSTGRMGIYNADINWHPTTLVTGSDAGTFAVDGIAIMTTTINVTLAAGRYLFAFHCNGAPTMRVWRGGTALLGLIPALGSNSLINALWVATTYAALASTAVDWTTITAGTNSPDHRVLCRISTP